MFDQHYQNLMLLTGPLSMIEAAVPKMTLMDSKGEITVVAPVHEVASLPCRLGERALGRLGGEGGRLGGRWGEGRVREGGWGRGGRLGGEGGMLGGERWGRGE